MNVRRRSQKTLPADDPEIGQPATQAHFLLNAVVRQQQRRSRQQQRDADKPDVTDHAIDCRQ